MLNPWVNWTIGDLADRNAKETPGRTAFITETEAITWLELQSRSCRLARSLAAQGVSRGDRVAMALPNCMDMVCLYVAVARLGAVNVFFNQEYDAKLLNGLIARMQPAAAIMDAANLAKLDHVSRAQVGLTVSWPVRSESEPRALPFSELMEHDDGAALPRDIAPSEPVQFIFTSGTTGLPKACVLSHRARISLSAQINQCAKVGMEDRFLACLPNYHGNVFLGIIGALLAGASCVIAERFSVSRYWDQVGATDTTVLVLHAVPLNLVLAHTRERPSACRRVRTVVTIGGRWQQFLERFGIADAVVGYGSTEAGGLTSLGRVTCVDAPGIDASFSGRVRSDLEVIIAGPDDVELEQGQSGEILVRPRIPFVMFNGYHGQSDELVKASTNFWYHSGDIGHLDEGGFLHFTGRARDALRVKGESVPVEYLEGLVREFDPVEDCAAVGVASALGDDELCLFVQPRDGRGLTASDVIDFVRQRVPRFMVPERVVFVREFPRSPATLKILKRKLIDHIAQGDAAS